MKRIFGVLAAGAALVAVAPAVSSADKLPAGTPGPGQPTGLTINRFFTGGAGTAMFVSDTTSKLRTNDVVRLTVPSPATDYAGANLIGFDPIARPGVRPHFTYRTATDSGNSLGSPRLTITFSDGGSIDVRPLTIIPGSAQEVGRNTNDYDNNGGTCGYLYGTTWQTAIACHAGATIQYVQLIADGRQFNGITIRNIGFGGDIAGGGGGPVQGGK